MSDYKEILNHFGWDNQLLKLAEEAAELASAIIKFKLNYSSPKKLPFSDNIAEEAADVIVLLRQLLTNEEFAAFVASHIETKKNRVLGKINPERQPVVI
jgi:NTP pyrophosphatase (non-canonical NTP hydrolase)